MKSFFNLQNAFKFVICLTSNSPWRQRFWIIYLLCSWCLSMLIHLNKHVLNWAESEVKVKLSQSCPTLWDPMGYTFHGILQARIRDWVAIPFSRVSSQPRDQTCISCVFCNGKWILYCWATREAWKPLYYMINTYIFFRLISIHFRNFMLGEL